MRLSGEIVGSSQFCGDWNVKKDNWISRRGGREEVVGVEKRSGIIAGDCGSHCRLWYHVKADITLLFKNHSLRKVFTVYRFYIWIKSKD
jgi:hypothetical protein